MLKGWLYHVFPSLKTVHYWILGFLHVKLWLSVYLESISFDTISFKVVGVGIEVYKFAGKHRKFDESVLSEIQLLQKS